MAYVLLFLVVKELVVAYYLFILSRIESVSQFRSDLLKQVSKAVTADINSGRSWEWRYDKLSSVKYERILHTFWRPLKAEAWYEDCSFLKG